MMKTKYFIPLLLSLLMATAVSAQDTVRLHDTVVLFRTDTLVIHKTDTVVKRVVDSTMLKNMQEREALMAGTTDGREERLS